MRLRLTPREQNFYPLFTKAAENLVTGAELLAGLVEAEPPARAEFAVRLKDAEHEGDRFTHEIMSLLNTSFITPFDREDIYRLASSLDDVMDSMEAAADLAVLYQVQQLPAGVRAQVEVLIRTAHVTAEAMPRLRTMSNLHDYWIEVNRLENEADDIYHRLLADLFSGEHDVLHVLKLKDVVEQLEEAADNFEKVANTVESIALKES
jgi:predicted phosphate transport protein (TIGR00153 family)